MQSAGEEDNMAGSLPSIVTVKAGCNMTREGGGGGGVCHSPPWCLFHLT